MVVYIRKKVYQLVLCLDVGGINFGAEILAKSREFSAFMVFIHISYLSFFCLCLEKLHISHMSPFDRVL